MILVKREFDLECGVDEAAIRAELKAVFWRKFPLISDENFGFVKRDRNTISASVVKESHCWDYAHIKHLCGARKLYVWLNVSRDIISEDSHNNTVNLPPVLTGSLPGANQPPINSSAPSSTSGSAFIDESISSLSTLVPNATRHGIQDTLIQYDNLDMAAESLSDQNCTEASTESTLG